MRRRSRTSPSVPWIRFVTSGIVRPVVSPSLLLVLARRVAPLVVVAVLAVACSPSIVPSPAPQANAVTPTAPLSVAPTVAPSSSEVASASPLGEAPATRASGTVKVHDGNTESEGNANDPKVCTFHLHFFLGSGSSGTWWIETQPGGARR